MNTKVKAEDIKFENLSTRAKNAIIRILKSEFEKDGVLHKYLIYKCRLKECGGATLMELKLLIENYEKSKNAKLGPFGWM